MNNQSAGTEALRKKLGKWEDKKLRRQEDDQKLPFFAVLSVANYLCLGG